MSGNRSKAEATAQLVELGITPRVLDLDLAAAYVGRSAAAFLKAVADKRFPEPLQDGTRRRWDKKLLDAAVDRRSGLSAGFAETPDDLIRAIDAA
jgi:predicted DNA-binding transcriptional regulator AlpA